MIRVISLAAALFLSALCAPGSAQTGAEDGCVSCHVAQPEPALSAPVKAFDNDIHKDRGFRCVDCHGGDPTTDDKRRAKDPARGYKGKPAGAAIVGVCARCHSNGELMRTFAPRLRVDQEAEYATSAHGIRLTRGDHKVATCVSCHNAHGVRRVNDPRAAVFPTNVADLCASCHSNAAYMTGYTLPDGSPIPTTQREEYDKSVHAAALTDERDLSAPTCPDCHGNHGAAPPGVGAVSNVCGTCHAVFAAKFARSVHNGVFERDCVDCHGNHAVLATSDAMIGTSKDTLCVGCHNAPDDPGYIAAGSMRSSVERLKTSLEAHAELIGRARNSGMEVSDQELALNEIRTKLTQARTEIHAFDPRTVDEIVNDGMRALTAVGRAGDRALAELRFRRTGLFVSLGAILIVVAALTLKIRELDRRRREGHSIE